MGDCCRSGNYSPVNETLPASRLLGDWNLEREDRFDSGTRGCLTTLRAHRGGTQSENKNLSGDSPAAGDLVLDLVAEMYRRQTPSGRVDLDGTSVRVLLPLLWHLSDSLSYAGDPAFRASVASMATADATADDPAAYAME